MTGAVAMVAAKRRGAWLAVPAAAGPVLRVLRRVQSNLDG